MRMAAIVPVSVTACWYLIGHDPNLRNDIFQQICALRFGSRHLVGQLNSTLTSRLTTNQWAHKLIWIVSIWRATPMEKSNRWVAIRLIQLRLFVKVIWLTFVTFWILKSVHSFWSCWNRCKPDHKYHHHHYHHKHKNNNYYHHNSGMHINKVYLHSEQLSRLQKLQLLWKVTDSYVNFMNCWSGL